MLFSEPAKVCLVSGATIRDLIRTHIEQLRVGLRSYEDAIIYGRPGVDWVCARENLEERLRAAVATLPVIGDGPHPMSMDQYMQIVNRFAPVRTADELLDHMRAEEAHRAAHAIKSSTGPAS